MAGVFVQAPLLAVTNRTVAPAMGSLERLSKIRPFGSISVTVVDIHFPQPVSWTSIVS